MVSTKRGTECVCVCEKQGEGECVSKSEIQKKKMSLENILLKLLRLVFNTFKR